MPIFVISSLHHILLTSNHFHPYPSTTVPYCFESTALSRRGKPLIKLLSLSRYFIVLPFSDGIPAAIVIQAELLLDDFMIGDEAMFTCRDLTFFIQTPNILRNREQRIETTSRTKQPIKE
jgi:hypothetical protein